MILEPCTHKAGYLVFCLERGEWYRGGKELIAALKDEVPAQDREYDPKDTQWYIKEKYKAVVENLGRTYLR